MSKNRFSKLAAKRGRIATCDRQIPKEAKPTLMEGTAMPRKCFLGAAVVAISIATVASASGQGTVKVGIVIKMTKNGGRPAGDRGRPPLHQTARRSGGRQADRADLERTMPPPARPASV